jgi:glucose dehydrogenase
LLFALDAQTGQLKWTYQPKHSIRHNAIAIGKKKVYVIDRPLAWKDVPDVTLRAEAKRRAAAEGKDETKVLRRLAEHPLGTLLALDSESGEVVWQTDEEIFGTLLALSEKHGVLVMSYQSSVFQLDSELGGRIAAIRAADGACLWNVKADYKSRPMLNDRTIYAQPGAWDLLSGKRLSFKLNRSYGCGIPASSKRLLVFRSATLGYVDLDGAAGRERRGTRTTENYGGIRPGCWTDQADRRSARRQSAETSLACSTGGAGSIGVG